MSSAKQINQFELASRARNAILFLTSNNIPDDENFNFVIKEIEKGDDISVVRERIFAKHFDEVAQYAVEEGF
jgi:hypothetical protein